ncbi:hypothetical protein [uncultured Cohaesibacter sp.]|uniref:hypothetical protein n=1 Tax=uncultured Cohaesibacter sp. TaxID=1002546 RepID=UPI0029317CE6|nr:hypothetical protein [uncultured Cohaesibacter sp.]
MSISRGQNAIPCSVTRLGLMPAGFWCMPVLLSTSPDSECDGRFIAVMGREPYPEFVKGARYQRCRISKVPDNWFRGKALHGSKMAVLRPFWQV